jgi:hypothetical protein
MAVVRQELDQQFEAQTGLTKPASKGVSQNQIFSLSRT